MIQLRPYQSAGIAAIREAFGPLRKRAPLYVLSTGGGKTVLFTHIAHGAAAKGNRVYILSHRQELIDQISAALDLTGTPHGFIAAGYPTLDAPVQIASVQTLVRRLDRTPQPDLIVIDEAHHARAETFERVIREWPKAKLLGVTATPIRLSGEGLGTIFDHLIVGPSMRELIDGGYLAPYRMFRPPTADASDLPRRGGEFVTAAAEALMNKPAITGSALAHYRQHADGRPALVFCVSIQHAKSVADQFREAGYSAFSIDGTMERTVRRGVVEDFRAGRIRVITSVALLEEGFDVPGAHVGIFLRPTQSLGLYLQQIGRILRPAPGKTCLARGTRILTLRGWVRIEDVSPRDLVYDGDNWVAHKGTICNGNKTVISYDGLWATPDHLVWTSEGWRPFGECAKKQIPLFKARLGRAEVRKCFYYFTRINLEGETVASPDLCALSLRWLRQAGSYLLRQFKIRAYKRMSTLQSAGEISDVALLEVPSGQEPLHESEASTLQKLWRSWDRFRIFFRICGSPLDRRESRIAKKSSIRIGQDRQRRWIPPWKSALVDKNPKSGSYHEDVLFTAFSRVSTKLSSREIRRQNTAKVNCENDTGGDRTAISPAISQAEREVWDILEAGPLHRFVAEGVIVHNCALLLDHVGNCYRHGLPHAPQDWSLSGDDPAAKRKRAASVRICAHCFCALPSQAKACSECGYEFPAKPREIEQRDGELAEVTPEMLARRAERREQGRAQSLEALREIARRKGYSPRWAEHVYHGRLAKQRRQA